MFHNTKRMSAVIKLEKFYLRVYSMNTMKENIIKSFSLIRLLKFTNNTIFCVNREILLTEDYLSDNSSEDNFYYCILTTSAQFLNFIK